MRTPTKDIVKKISKILRDERPDYIYLRDLFKKIRVEFDIGVTRQNKRLPYVVLVLNLVFFADGDIFYTAA